ncbi:MAG: hypothetical protein FWG30_05800 [Eubacteriaceae bacterium]|nr:hypothetical protein [Eubacteriaceae bacterium]
MYRKKRPAAIAMLIIAIALFALLLTVDLTVSRNVIDALNSRYGNQGFKARSMSLPKLNGYSCYRLKVSSPLLNERFSVSYYSKGSIYDDFIGELARSQWGIDYLSLYLSSEENPVYAETKGTLTREIAMSSLCSENYTFDLNISLDSDAFNGYGALPTLSDVQQRSSGYFEISFTVDEYPSKEEIISHIKDLDRIILDVVPEMESRSFYINYNLSRTSKEKMWLSVSHRTKMVYVYGGSLDGESFSVDI